MLSPLSAFRARLVVSALFVASLSTCVDAPSAPEARTFAAPFAIAPSLSLVGPGGEPAKSLAQADALEAAFDLVDHFRMVVTSTATQQVVVDTVFTVTPGQPEYDLSVNVEVTSADEQFTITLTALQGTTPLFTAEPVTVRPTTGIQSGGSSPPAPTNITMQYSGPGVEATSIQVSPAHLVLGTDANGTLTAEVQGSDGNPITGVPLSWTVEGAPAVTVTEGAVQAVAEGFAQVVVATPTGLAASTWAYVVGGELAYSEGGVVRVRGTAGGDVSDRSSVSGAGQPAWSPDGERLYYAAGSQTHVAGGGGSWPGAWPSVSPDGTKLASDRGGSLCYSNSVLANGETPACLLGPAGGTPIWMDGTTLIVSGGSVEQMRADGSARTTLVGGNATLPALSPDGRLAYVLDGQLFVLGGPEPILDGVQGRPSWSADGAWLVAQTSAGLTLVPSGGAAPGAPLPGLETASDPAFRTSTPLASPQSAVITGLNPDPPIPGEPVGILGSGFDWIIPENNQVFWPTLTGTVSSEILSVTATTIQTVMPRSVAQGEIRVETRAGTALLAFDPQLAAIDVLAATQSGDPVTGVEVLVVDAQGLETTGLTDDGGRALISGLQPGSYTVHLNAPAGFSLVGEGEYSLTLGTETALLEVEFLMLVESVTTVPADLVVEVGQSLVVTLLPLSFGGAAITELSTAQWIGGSPHLSAVGDKLRGTITGVAPSTAAGASSLSVELNGATFNLPVTVTSFVEGTVVQDPAPAGAPTQVGTAGASASEATTEPAVAVGVKVFKDGELVTVGETDGQGRYHAGGLFAGAYEVTIDPTPELSPVPDMATIELSVANPTAKVDFLLSRSPVSFVILEADPPEIDAIDGTTTITVTPFDDGENRLGDRPTTFVSTDTEIATVDANGVVTGHANGVAIIDVTVESVTAGIPITVDQKAVMITLLDTDEPKPLEEAAWAFVGDGGLIGWEAFDVNEHAILHKVPLFETTDPFVLSVDAAGNALPLAPGMATLTVTMDGATDAVVVNVLAATSGDLIINTAGDLAAAQAAQIGLVTGDLVISATSLTDLTGLETLREVNGSVYIQDNGSLGNLLGLGNLLYIGGDLILENNDALTTPAGPLASALMAVDGSLRVIGNAVITNVDGFGNVEHVGGDVEFSSNPMLQNLDGVPLIERLGRLYLQDNPALNSLMNLPGLITVGDLIIEAGAQVFGLPLLEEVHRALQIGGSLAYGNTIVQDIQLPQLYCVADGIEIYNNNTLHTVNLPSLEYVSGNCGAPAVMPNAGNLASRPMGPIGAHVARGVEDRYTATAERFASVHAEILEGRVARLAEAEAKRTSQAEASRERRRTALEETRARRDQVDMDQMIARGEGAPQASPATDNRARRAALAPPETSAPGRVDGPQLEYPTGSDVRIYTNPALTGLHLPSLMHVDGELDLERLGMTSLVLPSLQAVEYSLWLSEMDPLESFSAPLLQHVGFILDVYGNEFLETLHLPLLEDVGDAMRVSWNDALSALSFPALVYVNWDVEFVDNAGLPSVSLPVLDGVGGDVYFAYNTGLTLIEIATASTLTIHERLLIEENAVLSDVHVPGLEWVKSDVQIWSNDALTSVVLASAINLAVDGDVWIYDNVVPHGWAVTIAGLVHVGGNFGVEMNEGLESVTTSTTDPAQFGNVYVYDNQDLLNLTLQRLWEITAGDFYVQDHASLQTLDSRELRTIDSDLYLDALGTAGTALALSFGDLTYIGNYLYIQNSPGLGVFSLPSLTHIRYGGQVYYNSDLTSFGMPALQAITEPPPAPIDGPQPTAGTPAKSTASDFIVEGNDDLTSFDLSALWDVGELVIEGNPSLVTLGALSGLQSGSSVHILSNATLANLAGFAGVTNLHTLRLDTNPGLTDWSGLSALAEIVYFQVWNNGGAGAITLPALTRVWWNVEILQASGVTTISAPALTHIGDGTGPSSGAGNLYLNFNSNLATASFPSMEILDARLQITGTAIPNMDGFVALKSPVYEVSITSNSLLGAFAGLSGIGMNSANPAVAGNFTVTGNTGLCDDEVIAVRDAIEARNPGSAFAGTVTISNVSCGQQD